MAKYLARTCPQCGDYFGIVFSEPTLNARKRPIVGSCTRCGYRIAWALIRGRVTRDNRITLSEEPK